MKDSFLGRETEVPSEEANTPFETPALAESSAALCNTESCQNQSPALPLGQHHARPAPHPSEERSVKLIWEIHRVLLQEAGGGEAAPLGPPQGAVLHRAALQPGKGAWRHCQKPEPPAHKPTPASAQGAQALSLVHACGWSTADVMCDTFLVRHTAATPLLNPQRPPPGLPCAPLPHNVQCV